MTLDSATIYGGYVGDEIQPIEIQNLWGIYFNNEVGPIVGLRIEADGSVVKANRGPWERVGSSRVRARCPNGLYEKGQVRHPARGKLKDVSTREVMPTCRVATTMWLLMPPGSGCNNIFRTGDAPATRVNET